MPPVRPVPCCSPRSSDGPRTPRRLLHRWSVFIVWKYYRPKHRIVWVTLSSGKVSALGSGGPNGAIRSVYCDTNNNRVWVGGEFSSPSLLVAIWNPSSSSWSAPPFGELSANNNSRVLLMSSNSSESSLLFAGSLQISREVLSIPQITPTSHFLPALLHSLHHPFQFLLRMSRSIQPLPRLVPISRIFATSSVLLEMMVLDNRGSPGWDHGCYHGPDLQLPQCGWPSFGQHLP